MGSVIPMTTTAVSFCYMQAYALQLAVNARVPEFEASRQQEARRCKGKFHGRDVSMDLRTAASKVANMLQAAVQANMKSDCHPNSIATLSKMFKELRAGEVQVEVHRNTSGSKHKPASSLQG